MASGFAAPKNMGFYKGTAIMAVASGTTSRLTGGKFANGAVTGAFIQMFNVERIIGKWKDYKIENARYKAYFTLRMGALGGTLWSRTATVYQYRENYIYCENDCTQLPISYEYRVLYNHTDYAIGPAYGINLSPNDNPKQSSDNWIVNPWTGKAYKVK